MYWLKTVEGQDVESMATAIGLQPQPISMPKITYNNMLSYLIHAENYQNLSICSKWRFNDSWRRLPGYLQGK